MSLVQHSVTLWWSQGQRIYDVHLERIGKRDFLVLIELFSLGVTAESLRAKRHRECTNRRSTSVSLVGLGGSPGWLHLWYAKSSEYLSPRGYSQGEAANLKLYTAISQSQQAMRLRPPDLPDFDQLLEEADNQLFERILNNPHHTLYQLFPPQSESSQNYNPRRRTHDRQLHQHQGHLTSLRGYCTKIHTNSIICIMYCKLYFLLCRL